MKDKKNNMKTEQEIAEVVKRDGRVVAFEPKRIEVAIGKAVAETGEFEAEETKRLAAIVVTIMVKSKNHHIPTVEEVQDVVEQVLMAAGHYQTAKAYIIYRERHHKQRSVMEVLGINDDLGLSLNQLKVIEKRYLIHDEEGRVIESPAMWLRRVASTLAKVEKKKKFWEEKFFEVMSKFEFLPAGRTLNNAGTKQNQLANCFVLPVEDSMEGIFEAVKQTALIHQTGGGTGFNFSQLRPSGDVVSKSAGGFATGPVSFMKVFDVATRQVMQGGKKRGANMGIMNVSHPDIMEFIACKTEEGEIANFNISVGVTDDFMKTVKRDGDFKLINPRTGKTVQTVKARLLMDQMVTLAWRTGDPGMIFLDAINRNNPLMEKYGRIEATNPCGEQPLHPFDACNLGSINLAKFVIEKEGKKKLPERSVDWDRLSEVTRIAVRMLDNVIDSGNYPLPQITQTVKQNRRIGLGVMGFADMLYQLGVAYGSKAGIKYASEVMSFIQKESWLESEKLAAEKGEFPRWSESAFAKGFDPVEGKYKKGRNWKVRNVAITTIAPTGTISMVADCSSGIEPVFALSYVKNVVDDDGLMYVNQYFKKALEKSGINDGGKQVLIQTVSKYGSLKGVKGVPENLTDVFVTAHDISWQAHVETQAAFQRFTDNAVSKTINLPASASLEEVKQAYLTAWEKGCKGITVYRDKSKEFQVLGSGDATTMEKKDNKNQKEKYMIQSRLKVKTLKERVIEGMRKTESKGVVEEKCPECGGKITAQEGCVLCHECGWSACTG